MECQMLRPTNECLHNITDQSVGRANVPSADPVLRGCYQQCAVTKVVPMSCTCENRGSDTAIRGLCNICHLLVVVKESRRRGKGRGFEPLNIHLDQHDVLFHHGIDPLADDLDLLVLSFIVNAPAQTTSQVR